MVVQTIGDRTIRLMRGDITDIDVEAFVFDIDENCELGSGYGGAIAARAGRTVQDELREIGRCAKGEVVITGAGKMKASHIIHVNGPKFHEPETEQKLRASVEACLECADDKGIAQIAFPPIGTGMYQVPLDLCASVMVKTLSGYLRGDTKLKEVIVVALNEREYRPFDAALQGGA